MNKDISQGKIHHFFSNLFCFATRRLCRRVLADTSGVFHCLYHYTIVLHGDTSSGGWKNMPVGGSSSRT